MTWGMKGMQPYDIPCLLQEHAEALDSCRSPAKSVPLALFRS